jgi:hypothetical protein
MVIKTAKCTMDITVIKAIIDKADMDVSDNTVIMAIMTSRHHRLQSIKNITDI